MAKDKKSFLLYCDLIHTIEKLPDEKAGQLFKIILQYVNDKNPNIEDLLLQVSFEPIKQSLKRDLAKYTQFVEKQSFNGSKGGRPKKAKQTQKTQAFFEKPKKADSVSDSVIDINIISFNEFWSIYPKKVAKEKCEKKFKSLTNQEKEFIKNTINKFISYKPFPEYNHPNPETYLNQKRWLDEIPESKQPIEETETEYRRRTWLERNGGI